FFALTCTVNCGTLYRQVFNVLSPPCRPYEELTNCTFFVALKMHCFWPNRLIDDLYIRLHQDYFHDCALTGRLLRDPPTRILGPFIGVPVLVTLLMTALVVWSGKCCQGIV
uniref:Receptor activity-modifying protein 1 n=1 Tax=Hucho hucho TaxID=62062 RepID=A0A4W5LB34_9TELE